MIYKDELKRLFWLLRKHEDLLISAHLEQKGVVDESKVDYKDIDTLIKAKLLWQPVDNNPIRIGREISSLFDRVLKDPRRQSVSADIGGYLNQIELNIANYINAARKLAANDKSHFLDQIERLIEDLVSNLLSNSDLLWQKINSEFGYVSNLDLKIKENEAVLSQAKRLNDSLELIKVNDLEELVGNDAQLRHLIFNWLIPSVSRCRSQTNDALHKLNSLLFQYRRHKKLGRLIDTFYQHYQKYPAYQPVNYVDNNDIPPILNQVSPIVLTGQANLDDPHQEIILIDIIDGLRNEKAIPHRTDKDEYIEVTDDPEPITLQLQPLTQEVEEFYLKVIDSTIPLSAIKNSPNSEIEPDQELWIYAVISRFNNMEENEKKYFSINYIGSRDKIFNGRFLVEDVHLSFMKL